MATVARLRAMVAARTPLEGRNDTLCSGLRYYRFSAPIEYQKTQRLMSGIVVVLQGRKTVKLIDAELSYDEMNYLVLGAETICKGTVVTANTDCPYFAIHLDLPPSLLVKTFIALSESVENLEAIATSDISEVQDDRDISQRSTEAGSFVTPINVDILDAFVRLVSATDTAINRNTIAPLAIEEIVVRLLRSNAATAIRNAAAVTRLATRIQKSIHYIQSQFRNPLSVNDLASQVTMSPSHYAHSFRQVAGVSPMRYLRDTRLDEARVLMLASQLRPSAAAAQVGFESTEHFTREFKRRFDLSPTEYLRRMSVTA